MRQLEQEGAVRGFEMEMKTKSGQERLFYVSIERIELDGQPCLLHSGQDVTERRLAENAVRASEARLRALSARLESAREEEGRRIAREIHDELGGTLTTLKWNLDSLAKNLSQPVNDERDRADPQVRAGHGGSGGVHHDDRPADRVRPAAGRARRAGRGGGHRVAGAPLRVAHRHPLHLGRRRRRAGPRSRSSDRGLPDSPGDPHERAPPRARVARQRRDPEASRDLRPRGQRQRPGHRAGRTDRRAITRAARHAGACAAGGRRRQDSGRRGPRHDGRGDDPAAGAGAPPSLRRRYR